MTYCVAMRLVSGLIFASDSRTNGGVDNISSFSKMAVFEQPGRYSFVLLSSGNLATTQSVVSRLRQREAVDGEAIDHSRSAYEFAEIIGATMREVMQRDAPGFEDKGGLAATFIMGGQIGGEVPRLFKIYPEGNFIEAMSDTNYFQIGESKYGKPIIDRTIRYDTELEEAAKCILVSFDSTIRSNISVGLPLELACLFNDDLRVGKRLKIEEGDAYFEKLRGAWSAGMRQLFAGMPNPDWPER